jgi:hypothetical protein
MKWKLGVERLLNASYELSLEYLDVANIAL